MAGYKLKLARLLMAVGAHGLIRRDAQASLLILNYHRLHPSQGRGTSAFDDGVFDTDIDTFARQMRWLKASTTVLDEDGLLKAASAGSLDRKRIYSAVTFDDGYIDCYELARPILDELGIRALFFIPVEMIESRRLGWWDIAAYLLKRTELESITLDGRSYDLGKNFAPALKQILHDFKLEKSDRTEGLLFRLSDICRVPIPGPNEQSAELMTWSQIRQLRNSGHAIGSHAMSHRVLATLDASTQEHEIFGSRTELQTAVGASILSFAYPVGGPQHFNEVSVALIREAGYEQAFTFNTGISSVPIADRFQIPRESAKSLSALKAKALLPRVMGIVRTHSAYPA